MKSWNKKMKSGYVWKLKWGNVRIMNMLEIKFDRNLRNYNNKGARHEIVSGTFVMYVHHLPWLYNKSLALSYKK